MNRTGHQVAEDIYSLLKNSSLSRAVSGGVYHAGMRPRDSKLEDIVVTFVGGQTGEIQSLIAYVNIFVADIDPWSNGVLVENAARCAALEAIAAAWVETLTCAVTDYRITLYDTIHTTDVPDANQHFVCVPLQLDYWTCYTNQ